MIKKYDKRKTNQRGGSGFFSQALLIFVAFVVGYSCAGVIDFSHLAAWVNQQWFSTQSTVAHRHVASAQPNDIPKPKFEFYTLLANENRDGVGQNIQKNQVAQTSSHVSQSQSPSLAKPVTTVVINNSERQLPVPSLDVKSNEKFTSKTLDLAVRKSVHDVNTPALPLPKFVKQTTTVKGTYLIQVASFRSFNEAQRMKASLVMKGFDVNVVNVKQQQTAWYRVIIGPYASKAQAQQMHIALARSEHIVGMIRKVEV